MAFADAPIHQGLLHRRRRIQQAHRVGDRHAALADARGDHLVRHLEFLCQVLVGFGFLDRVQVGALDVFDQRQLEQLLVRGVTDDHRDGLQPGLARGLQTALARDQDVHPVLSGGHNQRLDHPMLADGGGKVFQLIQVEFFTGLARVALDRVDGNMADAAAISRRHLSRRDEGFKSLAESCTFRHECSLFNASQQSCLWPAVVIHSCRRSPRRFAAVPLPGLHRPARQRTWVNRPKWEVHTKALRPGGCCAARCS